MTRTLFAAVVVAWFTAVSHGAISNQILPGNTQSDLWADGTLTTGSHPGYGGFPGTGAWPAPIVSSTGNASLLKTANGTGGGPYPAGGSLYYGGFSGDFNNNGGTLAITDTTPVASVANVILQVDIGEAWGYDFFNDVLPTLSYNGGNQQLTATNSGTIERIFTGTVTMPTGEEPVYRNTWLVQWDLSGVAVPITSFSTSFTGVQHAQLYALRLGQSDSFVAAVVPEPATLGAAAMACSTLLRRRRRSI